MPLRKLQLAFSIDRLCDTGDSLLSLANIMSALPEGTLIIGGDFNLPAIKWQGGACCLSDHSSVNCAFLDIVNVFGLYQFVEIPTRGDNVLDLLLSNCPEMFRGVCTAPGISDHEIVIADAGMFFCQRDSRLAPRDVFLYDRGDYNSVSSALDAYYETFSRMLSESDTNTLWKAFKLRLHDAVTQFVPRRASYNGRKFVKPWTDKELLSLIKKRKRAFLTYKKNKSDSNKQKLSRASGSTKKSCLVLKSDIFLAWSRV